MRVQELIEKRAKVWETAKNFVDTHEDKNGNLSAEDKETYSRMEAEIEELTNSIERQQRAERREQELSKPVNSPITGKPYKDEPQGEVKTGRASDEYKKAMLTALRSNFRQVSNVEWRTVWCSQIHPRHGRKLGYGDLLTYRENHILQ